MINLTKLLTAACLLTTAATGCVATAPAQPGAGKAAALIADDPYIALREKQRIAREKPAGNGRNGSNQRKKARKCPNQMP